MKIEIMGTGCARCEALRANAEAAARKLGVEYELTKVSDLNEIINRGVIVTPALVIDGEVKVAGKVPGEAEITSLLASALEGR